MQRVKKLFKKTSAAVRISACAFFSAEDELEVVVNIKDMNDNHPEFLTFENPVTVSVSSQLQPGDVIAKMEVCRDF